MARLLTEGFELNSLTANVEPYLTSNNGTGISISSATVRSGSYSLQCNPSANWAYARLTYTAIASGIYYHRFYFYITSAPASQGFIAQNNAASTSACWGIALNSNSSIALYSSTAGTSFNLQLGSSSSVLSAGWHRIEISEAYTGNAVTAYLDGTQFATGTAYAIGGGTMDYGIQNAGGGAGSYSCNVFFDDIAINNNSGSSQNSLPGAGKVIALRPNATGDSNGFLVNVGGTAGVANNYTRVNEVTPDNASTYNASVVLNAEDLFKCGASGIGASDTVNVVSVGGRFANIIADATSAFKFEIEKAASGTKSQSAAIVPNSTTWKTNATAAPYNYPITLYKDPDGTNAWTQSTLDTMQIGYTVTTAGTNTIAVSTVWATVDYTPAAGATTSTSSSSSSVSTSSSSSTHSTSSSSSSSVSSSSSSSTYSTSSSSSSVSTSSSSSTHSTSSSSSSVSTSSSSSSVSTSSSSSSSVSTSSSSSSVSTSSSSSTKSTSSSSSSVSTSSSSSSVSTSSSSSSISSSSSSSSSVSLTTSTSSSSSSVSTSSSSSSVSTSSSSSTKSTSSSSSSVTIITTSTSSSSSSSSSSVTHSSSSSSSSVSSSSSSSSVSTSITLPGKPHLRLDIFRHGTRMDNRNPFLRLKRK